MRVFQLPIVEVVTPSGRKSFWVAAVPEDMTVRAVATRLPASHTATLLTCRLTLNRKSLRLRRGDVRLIRL